MDWICPYAEYNYDYDTGETWYECSKYKRADDCERCPEYVANNVLGGENNDD